MAEISKNMAMIQGAPEHLVTVGTACFPILGLLLFSPDTFSFDFMVLNTVICQWFPSLDCLVWHHPEISYSYSQCLNILTQIANEFSIKPQLLSCLQNPPQSYLIGLLSHPLYCSQIHLLISTSLFVSQPILLLSNCPPTLIFTGWRLASSARLNSTSNGTVCKTSSLMTFSKLSKLPALFHWMALEVLWKLLCLFIIFSFPTRIFADYRYEGPTLSCSPAVFPRLKTVPVTGPHVLAEWVNKDILMQGNSKAMWTSWYTGS